MDRKVKLERRIQKSYSDFFFVIYSCAAEAGLRVKVEGTATSDAVCENATNVPSSREITSYPPIDEIVTNNVNHPTKGNSPFPRLLFMLML